VLELKRRAHKKLREMMEGYNDWEDVNKE
jgi:hypothetical protein